MQTKPDNTTELVRTTILIRADTNAALRALAAAGKRPISWEIRAALEDHVERNQNGSAA